LKLDVHSSYVAHLVLDGLCGITAAYIAAVALEWWVSACCGDVILDLVLLSCDSVQRNIEAYATARVSVMHLITARKRAAKHKE
jgi:hypothetical protein